VTQIPRDPAFDSTLSILTDGYNYIWKRCQNLRSNIFVTRVMGRYTVCIHGHDATQIFYDESKLQRSGALPRRVITSLFGRGAIHTLDDAAHKQRKAAFMSLMAPAQLESLMKLTAEQWRAAIRRWERQSSVVLFDEVERILAAAVCDWVGLAVPARELPERARDLAAMVDAFGGVGPRLWKGKLARRRAERWIGRIIRNVRRGQLQPREDSALWLWSQQRGVDGELLSAQVAAVELLNVIRPTVAIAWYISFAALALHRHPESRQQLVAEPAGESAGHYADMFMQEVRRFYPFTPYLGAKVRNQFDWQGYTFKPGTRVLLDVYGTNHDPGLWRNPEYFDPSRFEHWNGDVYSLIPQGGGIRATGHRCPGEWITMHNIALALHFLTRCVSYEVVQAQDLTLDLSRMPTRPKSGFVISKVRAQPNLDKDAPLAPSRTATAESAAAFNKGARRHIAARA
jgi:fatty-acid peroxygenase